MNNEKFELIAKTFQGLEEVLAKEIETLGGEEIEIGRRMVSFIGDKQMMYKANLHLRTALRILKPIATFQASNTDEVYEYLKNFDWEKYIDKNKTFSIDSVVFSDNFRHSKFVTYRAKDAIADYFMEKSGERPNVRLTNADLSLNLHIAATTCTLSLDSSGESLHKRGYRVSQTEAPINEVLAAGLILKTGWDGSKNLIDPMCGSGTFLIEAALIATNTPPGVFRQNFAFEKWNDYDVDLFDSLYNDESGEKEFDCRIYGSDVSPRAIDIASENIKSAGMSKYINLKVKSFQSYTTETTPKDCMLIMNPPYGERISSKDLLSLYELIGTTLKHQFKGYDAWILSYREECFESIGLRPSVKFDVMNGALDCGFRKYEIFEGGMKDFKSEGGRFSSDEKNIEINEMGGNLKEKFRKERRIDGKDGGRDRRSSSRGRDGFSKDRNSGSRDKAPFSRERRGSFGDKEGFSKDRDSRSGERRFSSDRPERRDGERGGFSKDRDSRSGERRFSSDRPERRDGERGGFSKDRDSRSGERRFSSDRPDRRDGDRSRDRRFSGKPSTEDRPRRFRDNDDSEQRGFRKTYTESGNFKRNSEGRLEERTDGEYKPRGERTFNPNRKMYIPDNGNVVDNTKKDNEE